MNTDSIDSLITKLALIGFSGWLGKNGLDATTLQGGIAAAGTLISLGYGVYKHWNMIKVPAPVAK